MNRIITLTQKRVIKPEAVHPVALEEDGRIVLADCGDPELAYSLMDEMRSEGLAPERITHIIITHHDLDHMGGLSQFRDAIPDVIIMATAVQAEYICGHSRWLRLQHEDAQYLSAPPERRIPSGRVRAAQYMSFLPARVDCILEEGAELPFCGGCKVIPTPWHMPGHISLYLSKHKTLITGDALNTFGGCIGLNSAVDLCPEMTAAGLPVLAELDVETVCGYHGGELHLAPGQFRTQIMELYDRIKLQSAEKGFLNIL